MKKISVILLFLTLGVVMTGYSQAPTTTDFFAGKWDLQILGTPNGDAKFVADLTRKDGKLTGELADPTDPAKEKIPITKIEESADKLVLYFTAQGYDVSVDLAKVDDDNLKGMLLNMFEAKAKRLK